MDDSTITKLSRWRLNSPFVQTLLLGVIVFCGPGMNSTVLGLGAGGSRPKEISTVDSLNVVGCVVTIFAGMFGGSLNNKIGPRWTLMIGASGYPLYVGSFWWLDQGHAAYLAYIFGVYHGVCAGLFYSTAGFIVSSYSTEQQRGSYVAALYGVIALGSSVSSAIILGITTSETIVDRVPNTVYIVIISVQTAGIFLTVMVTAPASVRRNDNRPIAYFRRSTWRQELGSLSKMMISPKLALLSVAIFTTQMPVSFFGSLNAFYFNSRTRALSDLCFWLAGACGAILIGQSCDLTRFGYRKARAFQSSLIVALSTIGPWAALLWYLTTHDLDRRQSPPTVDWTNSASISLLLIFGFLGFSWATYQVFTSWLLATFSNDPDVLSRYSGYLEAVRSTGFAVAFGIDSGKTPFLTEAIAYFSLTMSGLALEVVAAKLFTTNSEYGREDNVVIPTAFELNRDIFLPDSDTVDDRDHHRRGSATSVMVI